jgi:hypothetical protein
VGLRQRQDARNRAAAKFGVEIFFLEIIFHGVFATNLRE